MFKTDKVLMALVVWATTIFACEAETKNKFGITGKIDFVSDYIWRGAYQNSGFSVQPTLGLSYGGFTVGAWGSQSLTKIDGAQEVDLSLSYAIKNFTITVTDYWWSGIQSTYGDYCNDHHFEAALSYTVSERIPLTLMWGTMFAGGDYNDDGKRAFSTYINASYNFRCPYDIYLTPAVGFTPWKGMYYSKGAMVTDVSLKASKAIALNERFSLPLSVQFIYSPAFDKAYLIGGFGFSF